MAEPVWGLLAKAQDDPTTIDEAIAAAIAAHEADPEAHLGSGESLEVHRGNEVLDHPLGSVLADKYTTTEFYYLEPFASLDNWNVVGLVSLFDYPQVTFEAAGPSDRDCSIYVPIGVVEDWITFAHDWYIQFSLRVVDLSSNAKYWWGEDFNNKLTAFGIGFMVDSNVLYATEKSDGTRQSVSISGIDLEAGHIYRVQYSLADEKIYYFVDGVQVASLTPHNLSYGSDTGPSFGISLPTSTDDIGMSLAFLSYSRAVN